MWYSPSDWCVRVWAGGLGESGRQETEAWLSKATKSQRSTMAEVVRGTEEENPERSDPKYAGMGTMEMFPRNSLGTLGRGSNLQQSGH